MHMLFHKLAQLTSTLLRDGILHWWYGKLEMTSLVSKCTLAGCSYTSEALVHSTCGTSKELVMQFQRRKSEP